MKLIEFQKIVEEVRKEKPIWFGLDSDLPCSDSDIIEIEYAISVQLPIEYKEFLKNFGGGYFAFTNVFSATKDSEWYVITRNEPELIESRGFLAISDNGVGDFYGYKVEEDKCESRISFFDHEDNQLKPTEYENLYKYLIKVGLSP